MPDYAKMKNSELETMLKSRNLPHNGKKAEMVARLAEADGKGDAPAAEATPTSAPVAAPAEPAESAEPAEEAEAPPAPAAAAPKDDAAKPAEEAAKKPEAAKPATDYSKGLPAQSQDQEAVRRQKRLERFGAVPTDAEEEKKKKRAEKFATEKDSEEANKQQKAEDDKKKREARFGAAKSEDVVLDRLNGALPDKASRKRGRAAEEPADSYEDSGLKRRRSGPGDRGRARGNGRNGRNGNNNGGDGRAKANGAAKPQGAQNGGAKQGSGSWMTDADREKAKKRAERFGSKPAAPAAA